MLDRDTLFTFAEIAIALAGFSAIIGVLSSRRTAVDLRVNALRLQVMLETCFMVAAASVAPILIQHFGDDTEHLWQIAAALFLCVAIPFEFIARAGDLLISPVFAAGRGGHSVRAVRCGNFYHTGP